MYITIIYNIYVKINQYLINVIYVKLFADKEMVLLKFKIVSNNITFIMKLNKLFIVFKLSIFINNTIWWKLVIYNNSNYYLIPFISKYINMINTRYFILFLHIKKIQFFKVITSILFEQVFKFVSLFHLQNSDRNDVIKFRNWFLQNRKLPLIIRQSKMYFSYKYQYLIKW